MKTYDYGKITAITNRHLCNADFYGQIKYICKAGINTIILREKDLSEDEYVDMAERVIKIAECYNTEIVLHTYITAARKLKHKYIHLPMESFRQNARELRDFKMIGVSTHTVEEAVEAERLGASYITASHIYETDCKKGVMPKGINYLKSVCKEIKIPVYALGGINFANMNEALEAGADRVCMMSQMMVRFDED